MRRLLLLAPVAAVLIAVAANGGTEPRAYPERLRATPAVGLEARVSDDTGDVAAWIQTERDVTAWNAGAEAYRRDVAAWDAGVAAYERDAQAYRDGVARYWSEVAAWAAAHRPAPPPPPAPAAPSRAPQAAPAPAPAPVQVQSAPSGDCGAVAAIVGWGIVQRESGGNPAAANPSGAYGCSQIMPAWWSGACSGLNKYTVDGQAACTRIIMSTQGSSAWAATR